MQQSFVTPVQEFIARKISGHSLPIPLLFTGCLSKGDAVRPGASAAHVSPSPRGEGRGEGGRCPNSLPATTGLFHNIGPWIFSVLLLALFLTACATPPVPPAPALISKIPGYQRDFQIVSQTISSNGKEAVCTLLEPTGIFAFRLDLSGVKLSKLTLIVQRQKYCEGLTFQPDGGRVVELPHTKSVNISVVDGDLKIEFGPPALEILRVGGRVQFINQYR